MKKFFSILAIVAFIATFASAQGTKKGPIAEFPQTEIDYGKIMKGDDPLRKFKFKNVGDEPLTITNAKGSCGCTVPTYPKEPIMPGASAEIEVRYDTQRVGPFSKSVTLTTNEANATRVLSIKGEVKDAPSQNQGVPVAQPNGFQNH
ncbi:MAG: hypothetical protein RLZZ292_461 [Bacteroidota bacterium]|jgi:hypothetical protein